MCIAIYSFKGTEIPTDDILKTCFRNNSDGAGFAFNTDNHQVKIVKGFMDFDSFITSFHEYDKKYCFKNRGVLIHFRIATHGKINGGCCHPFPITANEKHLKKLKFISNYAAIHNGIISLTASKNSDLSDTMLFIKDYLTKISSNNGWFNNPKNIELIYNLIDSKMAILNGNGDIRATKGFHQAEDGNFYSNDSYKESHYSFYSFYNNWFYGDDEYSAELECPLMQLKSNEMVFYDDGGTEEYEVGYHNLYPIYLTKEGDVYADFMDSVINNKVHMDRLSYLGHGYIVNKQSPIGITEFRKDVIGYI